MNRNKKSLININKIRLETINVINFFKKIFNDTDFKNIKTIIPLPISNPYVQRTFKYSVAVEYSTLKNTKKLRNKTIVKTVIESAPATLPFIYAFFISNHTLLSR
jgi:hypothetical protein